MGQVAKWDLYSNRGNWSEGEMLGQIFLTTENIFKTMSVLLCVKDDRLK